MQEHSAKEFARQIEALPPSVYNSVFAGLEKPENIAEQIESAKKNGRPLAGYACLVKDNFDVKGFSTRASSRFMDRPVNTLLAEGPLLKTARQQGLAILGKTQMNEFAYGLDGANPHYGNCPHPIFPDRMSGGSSSGSAWAVAKRIVPVAFGTDTGGSIRVPSAFCGLFGFRLPPNSWAKEGCFPLAPTFDSAGWMTSDAEALSFFTRALLNLPTEPKTSSLRIRPITALPLPFQEEAERIFGHVSTDFDQGENLTKPNVVRAFNILQSQEAYAIHQDWLQAHEHEYDPAVLQRIRRAEGWTTTDREEASETREETINRFARFFDDSDVGLLPASLNPAGRYPMETHTREELLRLTTPVSLAGLPVVTLPIPMPRGEVSGLQCLLPPDRWENVLNLLLQKLTNTWV